VSPGRDDAIETPSWNAVSGAVGDLVTVLPIVVAIGALSELSLGVMLVWFGGFQIVWGVYYGVPMSVEPMKALAALLLAGSITTGEYLFAGLLLGLVLLVIGATNTLSRVQELISPSVVRGIQLGVALVLLETGLSLGLRSLPLAGLSVAIALTVVGLGHWRSSAFAVLAVGGGVAVAGTGLPSPALPALGGLHQFAVADLTIPTLEAALGQLAMTIGNAALATAVLVGDYFDREVDPDDLSASMGVMNLLALPAGGIPMCHGSGGVAGKYAFGARTPWSNLVLGALYVVLAVGAVGIVANYPLSMLGVVLALVAVQLGLTGLRRAEALPLVVGIGLLGLFTNLGVAFLVGLVVDRAINRFVRD
jgi:MFS superfamily sulfate permease-like transporter